MSKKVLKKAENIFEHFIFWSRWIQAPIYVGLIIGSLFYSYNFFLELLHLIHDSGHLDSTEVMLIMLELVDISMVLNLIIIVVIGGYSTFVSKLDFADHEDKPDWLEKVDAGTLKIKLMVSLVSISGIHLLQTFVYVARNLKVDGVKIDIENVALQIIVHLVFVFSALLMAWTDKVLHRKKH